MINVDNTIRGFGRIDVAITNRGVIRAEGGELRFWSDDVLRDNSAGEIQVGSNGTLYIRNFEHATGTLRMFPGGQLASGSAVNDVALIGPAPLTVSDYRSITLQGQVLNSAGIDANLLIEGAVELRGGGELLLSQPDANIEASGGRSPDDHIVNHDNTLRGQGRIRVPVVNHHVLRAEDGVLRVEDGLSGSGDVEVASGATLKIYGDLSCLTLKVADGASFEFRGERLSVRNWVGDLDTAGDSVAGVHETGETVGPATVLGDARLSHRWTLQTRLAGRGTSQFDQLVISGDLDVGAAALDLSLVDGFCPAPGDTFQILTVGGTLTGTFADFPEGASVGPLCGTEFFITYQGGDGNDVVLWSQERPFCELCLPSWGGWRGTLGR